MSVANEAHAPKVMSDTPWMAWLEAHTMDGFSLVSYYVSQSDFKSDKKLAITTELEAHTMDGCNLVTDFEHLPCAESDERHAMDGVAGSPHHGRLQPREFNRAPPPRENNLAIVLIRNIQR